VLVHNDSRIELYDGLRTTTNNALELADRFLGIEYRMDSPGRYISEDNLRVVRIGDNDILGKHGDGRQMNFETLGPNPQKPGKMTVIKNLHIYLTD